MVLVALHAMCAGALGAAAIALPWPWALLPAWASAAAALVAAAYVFNWPQVFGKRPDGSRSWWRGLAVLPVIVVGDGVWRVLTAMRPSAPYHEVAEGLWLGGLIPPASLPASVTWVVDLTCEHARLSGGSHLRYSTLPTLDAWGSPDGAAFAALAREIAGARETVYIHCASGRGRAPTLMAAVFVLKGLAANIDDAVGKIRRVRSIASPSSEQRALAARALASHGA